MWSRRLRALEQMLAPMPVDDFLRSYLGRKPAFIKGDPAKFEGLFDWPHFARELQTGELPNRSKLGNTTVSVGRPGGGLTQLPIDPNYLSMVRHYTIFVHDVHVSVPALSALMRQLRTELGCTEAIKVACIVSPPGDGFPWHFDFCHNWVLQLSGAKRWRISEAAFVQNPSGDLHRAVCALPGGQTPDVSLTEHVLMPGDLLYLPPGFLHAPIAQGDLPSVHLTLQQESTDLAIVFAGVLRSVLVENADWRRRPLRSGLGPDASAVRDRFLADKLAQFQAAASSLTVESVRAQLEADLELPSEADLADPAQGESGEDVGPINMDAILRLQKGWTAAIDPGRGDDEAICVYRFGKLVAALPMLASKFIDEILRRDRFTCRQLQQVDTGADCEHLLRELMALGAIVQSGPEAATR